MGNPLWNWFDFLHADYCLKHDQSVLCLFNIFFLCRYAATRAVVVAITSTFFEFFNIPVFWPILVMYFIVLFVITMKRQIKVSKKDEDSQKHGDI